MNKLFFITSILLIIIFFVCAQKDESYVIKCGDTIINKNEFLKEYSNFLLFPHAKDNDSVRVYFANYLMNRRLLAEMENDFPTLRDSALQLDIKKTAAKYARQALLDSLVKDRSNPITDSLLRNFFKILNEKRKVSHLVFKDSVSAWNTYLKLNNDETTFEQEAFLLFNDSLLKNNGGNLGWLTWEQMDFRLAEAAFKSKKNIILKPILNKNYFHILKVDKIERGLFLSETDYLRDKKRLKSIYKKSRYKDIAYHVIQLILKNQEIKYDSGRLASLEVISKKLLNKQPLLFYPSYDLPRSEFLSAVNSLESIQHKTIASIDSKKISVKDLLNHIPYLDPNILESGMTEILGDYARDMELNKIVSSKGIDSFEEVREKSELYREKIIGEKIKEIIYSRVKVSEDEKISYYNEIIDSTVVKGIPYLSLHCFRGKKKDLLKLKSSLSETPLESILSSYNSLEYSFLDKFTFFKDQDLYNKIYRLSINEIYGPVPDKKGFLLCKIADKGHLPPEYKNYEKAIHSALLSQKRNAALKSTLDSLRQGQKHIINHKWLKSLSR